MPEQVRPREQPPGVGLAIRAWNLMGGIDWAALPIVCEMLGVSDVETLITQLVAIRDHQNQNRE